MFFINPFIYGGAGGDYESIATVTVGSGGASAIEFTSIPGTYQHLQLRLIYQVGTNDRLLGLQFNGVTSSAYALHQLSGSGASASAYGLSSNTSIWIAYNYDSTGSAWANNEFVGSVTDILDYANSSKATTTRSFSGVDYNGGGRVEVTSGLWTSTSAVTSLKLTPISADTFRQHSTFALYGIKAP